MKNLKKSLFILFSIFFALGITPITKVLAEGTEAISNPNPNISVTRAYTGDVTPFNTNYGNGGYTKIELYGNGREVWWSVKPNTSQSYTYSGLITVTFSDNSTRIYPVSKSGSGGQSVSGSFELPKKAKTAGISGVAYGPGGIQISIPTID